MTLKAISTRVGGRQVSGPEGGFFHSSDLAINKETNIRRGPVQVRVEDDPEQEARRDDPVDAVEVVRLLVRGLVLPVHHVDEVEDREEGADIEELFFVHFCVVEATPLV